MDREKILTQNFWITQFLQSLKNSKVVAFQDKIRFSYVAS